MMKFRTHLVISGELQRKESCRGRVVAEKEAPHFFSLRGYGNPLQITEHVLVQRAYRCVVSDGSEYRCSFVRIRTGFVR